MERRTAILAFTAGTLPVFAPIFRRAANAQAPANMMPRDLGQYHTTTLMLGSFALQSSQLATQRANLAKVKEFRFEGEMLSLSGDGVTLRLSPKN